MYWLSVLGLAFYIVSTDNPYGVLLFVALVVVNEI